MPRIVFMLCCLLVTSGCSVINFSANYYTPPGNYQAEIMSIWRDLNVQIPFKNQYKISLMQRRDSRKLNGIPAISDKTVFLPLDFVKYVYQNYYDDRVKIFVSVIIHEVSHVEYGLPSKPPKQHVKTDVTAIKLLGEETAIAQDYYRSLFVVKNYWFARKGVAGHSLNAGWNILNGASLFFGGPAYFADFFATDLSQRMKIIAQHYALPSRKCFKRSYQTRP